MAYDPKTHAKSLRARINTERPNAQALELMLEAALQDAYDAAYRPGKLTANQQERAINVLLFADVCRFSMDRDWKRSCKEETGHGYNCDVCEAHEILKALGYVRNSYGHWDGPK